MRKFVSDNSQLFREWDSEKNAPLGLFPEATSLKSNKKIWWK